MPDTTQGPADREAMARLATSSAQAARKQALLEQGWCRFPYDTQVMRWLDVALPVARRAIAAPENARWLRCGGTWFAGVNVLGNDDRGAVPGGAAIAGLAVDFIQHQLGLHDFIWDQAQVSVCYPGYPQPMASETQGAFNFRLNRDAAHLDGLRAVGPTKRRFLSERHSFLLAIPMTQFSADAAPFVIWQGSHEIMRAALAACFEGVDPLAWGEVDVTETYLETRRRIFAQCQRVEISAQPGEAYLVHRLALHGVAPWGAGATAGPDGRMIAYFRPEAGDPDAWLSAP